VLRFGKIRLRSGTLHLGSDVNEEIVLRFTTSEYDFGVFEFFPIKAKKNSEARVRKFWRRIVISKAEHLRLRWETIKNSLPAIEFM